MKPLEKLASANLRNGKIYLHPYCRTVKGLWIASEPIVVTHPQDERLGEEVLHVFAQSTDNAPHPEMRRNSDQWSSMKALVKAAGVRSYEAFADSTRHVGMEQNDDGLVLTPSLNGGFRRRFLYIKTKIHSRPVPAEVAEALMAAFDACTEE